MRQSWDIRDGFPRNLGSPKKKFPGSAPRSLIYFLDIKRINCQPQRSNIIMLQLQSILLAIILSTVWTDSNAASSHPSWSSRPSLLKRQFHRLSRRRQQQDTTISTTVDHNIPTGNDDNNSDILNAVFCVRGGGANGPCIGIDLGKCIVDVLCSVIRLWLAWHVIHYYHHLHTNCAPTIQNNIHSHLLLTRPFIISTKQYSTLN